MSTRVLNIHQYIIYRAYLDVFTRGLNAMQMMLDGHITPQKILVKTHKKVEHERKITTKRENSTNVHEDSSKIRSCFWWKIV